MEQEIIQTKHINEESALIVENYPYGFRLRTKIRYWIESNKKGDRFLSQTLNPKTNLWNKPKASIYNSIMVLTKDEKGYISYLSLYPTTDKAEILKFLDKIPNYDLNSLQKEQLRVLGAYSKVYEGVKFSIADYSGLSQKEIEKHEIEQNKTKELINQAVKVAYIQNEGLK